MPRISDVDSNEAIARLAEPELADRARRTSRRGGNERPSANGPTNDLAEIERRLWASADQLRANSSLQPSEYATPVLGLIFLRYADVKFAHAEAELKGTSTGRRTIGRSDFQARGV